MTRRSGLGKGLSSLIPRSGGVLENGDEPTLTGGLAFSALGLRTSLLLFT